MDALLDGIASDPGVGELLAPGDPIVAPSLLLKALLPVDSFAAVTQADIDSARGAAPEIAGALAAMTGTDADGTQVAIATIRLRDTGDESVQDAERRINQLAAGAEGPLRVSSVSPVVVEDEYRKATEEGMAPLIGLALLLIAALLLVFLRTLSDLLLTLLGLLLSLIWIVGAEGWLGPDGLELIGPPSSLTALVPIIVISLTVDYAIQAVSHYREQRAAGGPVVTAVRMGLQHVTIPADAGRRHDDREPVGEPVLPDLGDWRLRHRRGVGRGAEPDRDADAASGGPDDHRPAARVARHAEQPRPVSNALPGIGRVAEVLGRSVTRRPAPYFVVVIAVTTVLGFAATGLESGFSIRDILPSNGTVLKDLDTLDAAVGGSTEIASVLVKAEASETRTLLNLHDLTTAFEDEQRRPQAAAGPIQVSYGLLVHDWTEDSGAPGDKYDPELAALFREASAGWNSIRS